MHCTGSQRELDYDEVYNQSGPTNCTVYCGGIQTDLTGKQAQTNLVCQQCTPGVVQVLYTSCAQWQIQGGSGVVDSFLNSLPLVFPELSG